MAILRSVDGRFYEIPDEQLEKFVIPEGQVKEKLEACGVACSPRRSSGPPPACPSVIVQVFGTGPAGGRGAPPPAADGSGQESADVAAYGFGETGHNHCGQRCGHHCSQWHNHWHNNHHCGH